MSLLYIFLLTFTNGCLTEDCLLKRWQTNSSIYRILFHIPAPTSAYTLNLQFHLILFTALIINFPSNMPYSQAMQSSSSTIALQPLTSQWSLDSDDYRIHSKNHHRLYPPHHAKLSHLKSIIRWPQKSSPPTSLPYHIGDSIFFLKFPLSPMPLSTSLTLTTITVHGEKNV